jgi:hypothetical protein
VEKLEGTVRLESEEGKGSRFLGFPSKVVKFLPVYPDFSSGQISLISADFY